MSDANELTTTPVPDGADYDPEQGGPAGQDPRTAAAGGGGHRPRGRARGAIPTPDEVLEQLVQLNGLVALGLITPARAGVIQRSLKILLDSVSRGQPAGPSAEATQNLAELCRQNPHILPIVEAFLTDEQLAWVMEGAG